MMIKTRRRIHFVFALALLAVPGVAQAWQVPDADRLPDDAWGREVRAGRSLVTDTPRLIGPLAPDPQRRFAGNALACQSCHLEAGTKEFGLPFIGVYGDFPQYRGREGRVATLEDRINGCMTRSLNGRPLPADSAEMRALLAYLKFLSTGVPIGAPVHGRGAGHMPELDRAADPVRGAQVYAGVCAACHGPDGAGLPGNPPAPALWGSGSFNDGAGMARLIVSANFIHNNMPYGTTWQAPALSVADAWDVAAFLVSQPRPHLQGAEHDYPTLRQKPVDAGYGPYADTFSQQQHRFGPFKPIEAARHLPATTPPDAASGAPHAASP
ncbi:MAG: c-type cytochrome [Alphaproteobacteria bacterium]|nr:c-type cytochrome [Alphaproteobacteria bacterium]